MIDEYFKKLNTILESTSMTDEERSRVRGALVAEMTKAPLNRFDTLVETTMWYFSTMNYRRIVAAATASAILFTMGGVSYAAEASLPGDSLYTVKVDFNEAVVEFLAVSDEDKAKVQTEFAQKRLEEASQLAAEGNLDQHKKDIVSKKLQEHIGAVKEGLDTIIDREDYISAVEVATEFEATVRAHTDVLVALVEQPAPEEQPVEQIPNDSEDADVSDAPVSDDTSDTDDAGTARSMMVASDMSAESTFAASAPAMNEENVASLALVSSVVAEVAEVVAEITEVREQAQTAVADSFLVSKRAVAEEKRIETEAVVADIERALSSTSTLVIEVSVSASSTLASIREGVFAGNLAFNEERYDDAFRTYNEALLVARELDEKVSALADLPRQVVVSTPVVVIPEQQEAVVEQEPVRQPQLPIALPSEPEIVVDTATTTATSTATTTTPATAPTLLNGVEVVATTTLFIR